MKLTFLLTCLLQRGKTKNQPSNMMVSVVNFGCFKPKHACFLIVRQQIATVGNPDINAFDTHYPVDVELCVQVFRILSTFSFLILQSFWKEYCAVVTCRKLMQYANETSLMIIAFVTQN